MSPEMLELVQNVLVYLLATAWIPTVIGVTYLIWIYWRSSRNWLIATMLIISIDVTIAVLYISYASSVRLLGLPPLQYGPLIGATVALLLAGIVPYLAFRVWWTLHGGPHPSLPTPAGQTPDGKEDLQ